MKSNFEEKIPRELVIRIPEEELKKLSYYYSDYNVAQYEPPKWGDGRPAHKTNENYFLIEGIYRDDAIFLSELMDEINNAVRDMRHNQECNDSDDFDEEWDEND